MCKGAKAGRTPSSARDPLVALLQTLSTFERDGTLVLTDDTGDAGDEKRGQQPAEQNLHPEEPAQKSG